MNSFDLVVYVNAILAARALLSLQPCTMYIAGNHIVAAQALSWIQRNGQPLDQTHIPPLVFSAGNLEIASNLFLISTGLLLLGNLIPYRPKTPPPLVGPLPRLAIGGAMVFVAIHFISSKSILETSYVSADQQRLPLLLSGGLQALFSAILMYHLFGKVRAKTMRPLQAFMCLGFVFFLTDYIKGSTGIATGFLLVALPVFLSEEATARKRLKHLVLALATILFFTATIRGVRQSLHSGGQEALTQVVTSLTETIVGGDESAVSYANGNQYATHVLECITLYEAGISREWRSIYGPLEYTFKPQILMQIFEMKRSQEAAWELMGYFVHTGGIYVLGELYWNGGYLCLVIVLIFLNILTWGCDHLYRHRPAWLWIICVYAPTTLQGFGYGFAQVIRGFITAVAVLLIYAAGKELSSRYRKLSLSPPDLKAAIHRTANRG